MQKLIHLSIPIKDKKSKANGKHEEYNNFTKLLIIQFEFKLFCIGFIYRQ